jgi:uncharacterized repeat protein (TIGR01451 family)
MSTYFQNSLFMATAIVLTTTGAAFAQQTAANTLVTSSVDLSYTSGVGTPTVELTDVATVEFRVDRKIDLIVASVPAAGEVTAVPGQSGVVLAYLLTNLGNDTQGYVIQVTDGGTVGASGLTYSATATTDPGEYYVVTSPTTNPADGAVYDVTAAGHAFDLTASADRHILIVANVPIDAVDQQFDDFLVRAVTTTPGTATAVTELRDPDPMEVSTVFADAATDSTRTSALIDAELDGRDADEVRLTVTAPQLSVQMTVLVLDENLPGSSFNCATGGAAPGTPLAAIPGACLEYTITLENDGVASTAATEIVITDAIPQYTTYAGHTAGPFTVSTTGAPVTSVTAALAELAIGGSAVLRVRVTVD